MRPNAPFGLVMGLALLSGLLTFLFREVIFMRLFVLMAALLLLSAAWTGISLRGVELSRTARATRLRVGQYAEQRFALVNRGRLPHFGLEVRDESPLSSLGSEQGSRYLTRLGGGQRRSYSVRVTLRRRGVFPLGPTLLLGGDPFGLFSMRRAFPSRQSVIVYPYLVRLENFVPTRGQMTGGRMVPRRALYITPFPAGARQYLPGDPYNRIHWKATAHSGRLMSKEFEQDPQSDVWLFLDAGSGSHYAPPPSDKGPETESLRGVRAWLPKDSLEYAVSVAATLAEYYLRHGEAVGLATAAPRPEVILPAHGTLQLARVLEALASAQRGDSISMTALVEEQVGLIPQGGLVLVVGGRLTRDLWESTQRLLDNQLSPLLVLADMASFGAEEQPAEDLPQPETLGVPVLRLSYGTELKPTLEEQARRLFPADLRRG